MPWRVRTEDDMRYTTILLDVDDTLLDFGACERAAF